MYIKRIMKKEYLLKSIIIIFLLLIAFIFLMNSPLYPWIGSDTATDSSVFKTVAMMMDKGYMPYLDTFDHKGPLLYILNWIGLCISSYRGIWVIEYVFMCGTFYSLYKIARLKCNQVYSCIVLLIAVSLLFTYFEGGNLTEEYAMFFIALSLFLFLDYLFNDNISKLRLIICGFCFMSVLFLRPNMIAVWLVFCLYIFIKELKNKNYKLIREFVIYFVTGILLLFVPTMIWIIVNGALNDFIYDYIIFNGAYSSTSGIESIANKWNSFINFFNTSQFIFATISCFYFIRYSKKNKLTYLVYLLYMIISLLLVSLSGRTYPHYGMVLVPILVLPIATVFSYIDEYSDKITLFILSAYMICNFIAPYWNTKKKITSRASKRVLFNN